MDEPEDDSIVTFAKIRNFLYDPRNRMKGARSFFKAKGIYSFSSTRYGLTQDIPVFLLNFSNVSELEAYTGKKMYLSVSGFGIVFKEDQTVDSLHDKLIKFINRNVPANSLSYLIFPTI